MTEKTTITAPRPGVFYRRPDPDEEPFVEEGDAVEADDVVGLVGVMKTFHEITAGTSGVVTGLFAENETEIDVGQALLEIETD